MSQGEGGRVRSGFAVHDTGSHSERSKGKEAKYGRFLPLLLTFHFGLFELQRRLQRGMAHGVCEETDEWA